MIWTTAKRERRLYLYTCRVGKGYGEFSFQGEEEMIVFTILSWKIQQASGISRLEKTSCSPKSCALRLLLRLRVLNDLSKWGLLLKPYLKGLDSCCTSKITKVQQSHRGLNVMLMCRSHIVLNKHKPMSIWKIHNLSVSFGIEKATKKKKKQGVSYSVSSFYKCQIAAFKGTNTQIFGATNYINRLGLKSWFGLSYVGLQFFVPLVKMQNILPVRRGSCLPIC